MACLTGEEISHFLKSGPTAEGREPLEDHLSRCPSCRRRLASAYRDATDPTPLPVEVPGPLLERVKALPMASEGKKPAGTSRWWLPAAAVLLAVLGLVAFQAERGTREGRSGGEVLRSGGEGGFPGGGVFEGLFPEDGAVLGATQLELRWAPIPGSRRTTLTVVDALGDIVLRAAASEGRFSMAPGDPTFPLSAGGTYFWYLTAELEDGRAVESRLRRFAWSPAPASEVGHNPP